MTDEDTLDVAKSYLEDARNHNMSALKQAYAQIATAAALIALVEVLRGQRTVNESPWYEPWVYEEESE